MSARCQEQVNDLCYNICIIERRSGVVSDCEMPSSIQGVMRYEHDGSSYFIVISNRNVVIHRQSF